MKTVSVCLAVYGYSEYLEEQLFSIFSQSFMPSEMVVIEDFSGLDSPRQLIESLCIKHGVSLRYRLLNKNVGPAKAFQIGCRLSTGEVLVFCDHDDIWAPDRLLLAVDSHDDYDIVMCNGSVFETSCELASDDSLPKIYEEAPSSRLACLLVRNTAVGATMSVDGDLIRAIASKYPFYPMHDWNLVVYAAMKRRSIYFIDRRLVMYRRHGSTFTGRDKNSIFVKTAFRLKLYQFVLRVLWT